MLKISCLGPWQINIEDDPAMGEGNSASITLQSRKEIALMAYLAVENGAAHSRDELSGLFFPDYPEQAAQSNLRVVLSRLRTRLGPYAQYLRANRLEVQFQVDPNACWLDTAALSAYAIQIARTTGSQHLALLEQAARLYRGDFMQGLVLKDCESFDQWLLLQRERHHIAINKILNALAQQYETRRRYTDVVATATQQLTLNPIDETAHRTLLKALIAQGKRAQALAQHNAFVQTLQAGMGIEPSPDTQALADKILRHQPVVTRPAPPFSLPAQFTSFVGRKREVADIVAALTVESADQRSRLVSLLGDGGVGKTRTALQVAEACTNTFAEGLCFVALSALKEVQNIPSAILQALKASTIDPSQSPRDVLLYALRHRHLLIILDNAEHLLDGADADNFVQLLIDILHGAPNISLLVTSRERLGMQAEDIFVLRGLPLPVSVDDLDNDALQLFLTRAKRIDKRFELNPTTLPHVQRICNLTGGIPLAIELAAAALYHLSIEQLALTLADSLDVLSASLHDLTPSHRSIRACFNETWQRLSEDEQNIAACLSVFAESFGSEAALAICQTSADMLERLHARSLLVTEMTGELRYSLHPLLRSFLREKLDAQSRSELMRAQHAAYFHRWLGAQEDILDGSQPRTAIDALLADLGNLREAWAHTIATHDTAPYVATSCRAYTYFVREVNLVSEARRTLQSALDALPEVNLIPSQDEQSRTRVILLQFLALLEVDSKANKDAALHAEQAEQLAQTVQDTVLLADVLSVLAETKITQLLHCEEMVNRALSLLDQTPSSERTEKIRNDLLLTLGHSHYHQRKLDQTKQIYEQIIQRFGRDEMNRQLASALQGLSSVYFSTGQLQEAIAVCDRVIEFTQNNRLGKRLNAILLNRATIFDAMGDYSEAQRLFKQCLDWAREAGNIRREAELCGNLGISHDYVGRYQEAIEYTQMSIDLWRQIGSDVNCDIALINLSLHLHHIDDQEAARRTAQETITLSQRDGQDMIMAYGQTMLGHAEFALDQWDAAEIAYSAAIEIARKAKVLHITIEPMAGLARVALQRHNLTQAREHITHVLTWLNTHGADNLEEPFRVYLTCVDVLHRSSEATEDLLARANALLNVRAQKITDSETQFSFLNNVQAHRELRQRFDSTAKHAQLRQ